MRNWLADILHLLAHSAVEHPFLIGGILVLIVVSTSIHAVVFAGHLFLGLFKYFRRQTAELQDLTFLYREEWQFWRQIFDVARVRSMSRNEIDAELKRQQIDVAQTTQVVASLVELVVTRLRDPQQDRSALDHRQAASSGVGVGPIEPVAGRFAICIRNDGYEASLEMRKLYPVVEDAFGHQHSMIRIVDESGEDYLFPSEYFVLVSLPTGR